MRWLTLCIAPTALYECLVLSSDAMTNPLNQLERRGLVEYSCFATDSRNGAALIDALLPVHVVNEEQALRALTAKEQAP